MTGGRRPVPPMSGALPDLRCARAGLRGSPPYHDAGDSLCVPTQLNGTASPSPKAPDTVFPPFSGDRVIDNVEPHSFGIHRTHLPRRFRRSRSIRRMQVGRSDWASRFASRGPGVLAPRGWYCSGAYGSSGRHCSLHPNPLRNTTCPLRSGAGLQVQPFSSDI